MYSLVSIQPAGPWPAGGTVAPKNGRLPWSWVCTRCECRASDSSRVLEVLRRPCGQLAVRMERAAHEWSDGFLPCCGRCGLICSNGRLGTAKDQLCPVPRCTLEGQPWRVGDASLRREIGRLHAFRKWCEEIPALGVEDDAAAPEAAQGLPQRPPPDRRWLRPGPMRRQLCHSHKDFP